MLLAGLLIGSLGTVLWQGMRSKDSDIGSGIRQMMETSRQQTENPDAAIEPPKIVPKQQSTNYDFFTVLPEIEVVVSGDDEVVNSAPKTAAKTGERPDTNQSKEKSDQPQSAYMLQAGSYNRKSDAERQKASLAFLGLGSSIQKVTIQGRGDFFRVRVGPFTSHANMVEADKRLQQEGIKALRLKISRAG